MGLPPIATLIAAFAVLVSGREISGGHQQTPADFDCPEEFGYYAHPTDCTQYYVCVFGGALLESCTGGLMYSHELQTCDWPRNVGCAPGQHQALQQQEIGHDSRQPLRQEARQDLRQEARQDLRQEARQDLRQELRQELVARQELRQDTRQELRQDPRHDLRPEYRQVQEALRQSKQPQQQQQILQQVVDNRGSRQRAQITVPKADLYNTEDEELGPAVEELEIDRQQRVYRGQPSTLGQVASDRDGLTHSNAIPVPATGGRDKLSVVSYGAQQQYNSKTKPIRTDGIVDLDHNFLTNTQRVRMKRDSNSSYQQSPGPQPFQRRTKKHNRKKRQHHPQKMTGMVMAGHKNNNSPNDTDSNGAANHNQDHKDIREEDNDEADAGQDQEEDEDGGDDDEEEEEEEEESENENNNEDGEEEEDSEKSLSEEHKNHSKEEDKESSSEKSNEGVESNENNKTSSSDDFKVDFPKPPSSWESFEDFKDSFGDVDFDVEKFLEELKSDSLDDINMFASDRKMKKNTKNNIHSGIDENGLTPATITVPIISGYRPTEVKFELYLPRSTNSNITTERSLKTDQLSSFLPMSTVTTPSTDHEDWKKSLTVPTPAIAYTPSPPFNPSFQFSGEVSLKQTMPQQENSEIKNNNKHQSNINRRSEEYPSHFQHQQEYPRSRSQGQRRRNMWREQPNSGERVSLRGQNRGRARYTFETPPYAMINTTPNYSSDIKPSMNFGSNTTGYGTRSFQQPQPTRSWIRENNPKPTGDQHYRFTYATHFNTALHRPDYSKGNHVQIYETTTPRQTTGRITQQSEPNQNVGFHPLRPEINYNPYEHKPQEGAPNYRRERQNQSRLRNSGNIFYRSGGKSGNLIGMHSTFQPVIASNLNKDVIYPTYFSPPNLRHQNQIRESNPHFLTNSHPTNIPSFLKLQPVVSILNQPVSIPELKNEESLSEEQIYHQNRDEQESPNTESTLIYDKKLAINNNDNSFRKNSSVDGVSFTRDYQPHTSPRSSDIKSPIVVSPIYNATSSFFMSSTTAIPRTHSLNNSNLHKFTYVRNHNSEIGNPKDSISLEKLHTTASYPKHSEEKNPELFNYRFDSNSPKNIKSLHQEFSPKNRVAKPTISKGNKTEYQNNQIQLFTNKTKNHSISHKSKEEPVSFIYLNQKIGPVQKVAIFRNTPTEEVSNENDDYYDDYDEEDYEDHNNNTRPKLPSIPKTLQNIDYQEFEDNEYDDYSEEVSDYDDGSKNSLGYEMGSGENDYDEDEDEEDMNDEGTNKGDKAGKISEEGSVERPQTVTPKPGCIFAGRSAIGRKRLLCPRNHLTDKPTTKADDQTNSEQTRRTITLLRASVQQPVQQQQAYDTRGYNTSRYIQQQQQPQQYTDPNYYSVYDEEAEQYKDIGDYAQYIQQNKQDIYTRKKPSVEIVQQEPVQRVTNYQKSKYSNQPENIYQSVTPQEYESYSIQNNDDLYRQVQTKSNNRFPDVTELASTPGERRLTLSAKFDQAQLPTDTSTRTDRVGSGFRLGNIQTEANVINITPRKRGGSDTSVNTFPISERASLFAKQVNALAPSITQDPVSKVLNTLTKSGEFVSDEASIEQSKEVNQVTTERARKVKTPLTVEEIDIAHLKSFSFQSTPASRFRIATTTSETPYIQPVIAHNQFSDRESFAQDNIKTPPALTKTTVPLQIQKFQVNDHIRNEQQVTREDDERAESKSSEDNDFRATLNKEYEQHKQQNAKYTTNNRLRGTFRHHNSGEVIYTDPASEQNYSDQSSSQELPKEWRELTKSKIRDPSKQQHQFTTKAPQIISINKDQVQFRPVTVNSFEGLTTAIPPRKVDTPALPESISLNDRQRQLIGDFEPASYADVQNSRTPLPNKADISARTQKPLLIRIPEKLRVREDNIRKIEAPRIRDESYEPGKIRVIPEREQPYNERFLVNTMTIIPEDSDPTSEEARKPISIRIPDYLPKSQESEHDHDSYPSRKQHIKPREKSESESERDKPTPIRYFDSMEYSSQSKEDNSRGSNRFRGTIKGSGNSYESEPIEIRGSNLRSREHLNSEANQEPSAQLLDERPKMLQQTDIRQRLSANPSLRSKEQKRIEGNQGVERPVVMRVPDSIDTSQYQVRDESKPLKIFYELKNPNKTEESTQRRGEYRSRGRQPEAERDFDKGSDITNRFEVATTLRPTNRLIPNLTTTKTIILRPPKKYRNGTIYTDQTLPSGTDTTDFPPSAEPDSSIRARPMSNYTPSTPGLTRGSQRHRGSQTYTVSPNEAEPGPAPAPVASVVTSPPRGTLPPNRGRPTLKPSTTVVGKATEFIDIYRFPPSRPQNVYPTPQVDKTAAKCRKDVCLLPDCYCGGKDIPGDLTPEETPQIVLLTFDDSVNDLNKGLYSDLFDKGRVNPNGCPISATFYVSHEWTDYSQVQNLYSTGHEIASHSVSHSFGEQFSQKKWTREISGQREILAAYGGVKLEDIRGMRAPFLAVGGNKMFKMLYDSNFTYDSSMPVYENRPPSWPYTLDYKVFHDCMIPPCPTKSYPGIWEVPMVMWQDLNGGRCSMGDACSNPPEADGVYKMLLKNFERHFTTNRAPFGLFYHAAWFTQPHHKEGFIAFLDTINKMPEVWLITNWQAVQWVRDPTPLSRIGSFAPFQCNYQDRPKKCNNPKVCNLWHKSGVRYMRTCQPCPEIYPWTGKSGVRNSRVDNDLE